MSAITAAGACLATGLQAAGEDGGLSGAVAGTGPLFLAFLAVHVPAGLAAVISGALAATAPKRRGRHTLAGAVYYWAIVIVFATATAMAVLRPARDWYLALLGALAIALAAAGRDYRRHPGRRPWRRWSGHVPHIIAMGGSCTVLLTAFYVDNGKNLPLWDRLPTAAYWALPALVAAPLIARSVARHRHPRTLGQGGTPAKPRPPAGKARWRWPPSTGSHPAQAHRPAPSAADASGADASPQKSTSPGRQRRAGPGHGGRVDDRRQPGLLGDRADMGP